MNTNTITERYATLLAEEIADEVVTASPDFGFDDQSDEGRAWLLEFYGALRSAINSDNKRVEEFLKNNYADRVGDLDEQELTTCADAFADRIRNNWD